MITKETEIKEATQVARAVKINSELSQRMLELVAKADNILIPILSQAVARDDPGAQGKIESLCPLAQMIEKNNVSFLSAILRLESILHRVEL